jgi:hypothetical protein
MIITAIGLVLVLATAIALAWPLLSQANEAREAADTADPTTRLQSEKDTVLAAIREADFDHEVGKLSAEDHRVLRAELEERAVAALAAIDRAATHPAPVAVAHAPGMTRLPTAAFCPSCGQKRTNDAEFCSRCGKRLARGGASERRRRA